MTNTTSKKKKNVLFFGLIVVLIFCIGLVFVLFQDQEIKVENGQESDYHVVEYNDKIYDFNSSIVSLLFMGIDTTDSEIMGQADSLQLYLLNRDTQSMHVLNISRDAMTKIHLFDMEHNDLGYDTQHINLAYAYGTDPKNGAMLTCEAVRKMLYDVPVNYFAAIDLSQLSSLHEVVQDLLVEVPNDSLVSVNPEWTKGSQVHITTENVESFVRTRDTGVDYSNQDRMERQQAYLNAYFIKIKEMLSKDFDSTVSLLYNITKKMTTNVTLENIETFSNMIMTYSYDPQSDFYELPGENQVGPNHDEFVIDQKELKKLVLQLFYKEGK